MAIPTTGTVTPGSDTAYGTTLTFSHTSSTNLLVVIGGGRPDGAFGVASCTYNGVAMTQLTDISRDDVTNQNQIAAAAFYLENPAQGANDVVLTLDGTGRFRMATAIDVDGFKVGDPVGASSGAPGNNTDNPTDTVTSTVADSLLIFGAIGMGGDTDPFTAGTDMTKIADFASGVSTTSDGGMFAGKESAPTVQTYTVDCTMSVSEDWATGAVEINPAVQPAVQIPIFSHHYKTMQGA